MQLISRDEDKNFVKGECQHCGKILEVERNLLVKSSVGYDISPSVTCSCGTVQTSIYKIYVPEVSATSLEKSDHPSNNMQSNNPKVDIPSQSYPKGDDKIKHPTKKYVLGAIVVILILVGVIGFNQYQNNINNFNFNVFEAEKHFSMDEYSKAKEYYQNALRYRGNIEIQTKVKLCESLLSSLNEFNKGADLFIKKDYLGAIDAFEKVIQLDEKRYSLASAKITEIKALYIIEQLQIAKNFASKKEYESALFHINKILTIDGYHQIAITLKTEYINAKEKANKISQAKAEADAKAFAKTQGVWIGMTQQQVLDSSWGRPKDINKTTTKYGTHEQWVYNGYNYLYFDDGILTSIQN